MKRVFLIVLDSCGCGAMADSPSFGDVDVNTLRSCARSQLLDIPNLRSLGLGNVQGLEFLEPVECPLGAYGRMEELSAGKDTTIGHWEIAGVVSTQALPTYPQGFPPQLLEEYARMTGRGILCNLPYSGTQVIQDYGDEHCRSVDLIVYTSADSVFQVAAHEGVVPLETLYEYCRMARQLLVGEHGVGRVIARPFEGTFGAYKRTSNRHDYSLEPPAETMLDRLKAKGMDVIGVGKINDIFAGRGLTEYVYTGPNRVGMQRTDEYLQRDFRGLCFVNLVDFDMVYGHRRDIDGYAAALTEFDKWLGDFMGRMADDDLLIITADHGCDPGYTATTDHTREYVPLLVYAPGRQTQDLGTLRGFDNVARMVEDALAQ